MIATFADKRTRSLFETGAAKRFSGSLGRRAQQKLYRIHLAHVLEDLHVPPGNRLEALKGDRRGQYSIRINDQWRSCFTWRESHAYDVEVVDYH